MAVENNKVDETFAMNGVLLEFSVTGMRVTTRDTIKAYVLDNTDPDAPIQTDLVLDDAGTDGYSVELVTENSVNVTVISARTADFELVVYRELDLLQESDYTDYGKFPAETVEDDFDEGILIDQQIDDKANRALKLGIGVTGVSVAFPNPAADSVIGWNAALDALENKPDLATQVAAAEAAQAAAEAAETAAANSAAAALASQTAAGVSQAAALVSENAAAADLVLTNADVVTTNADVVLTALDVVATNADVIASAASAAAALVSENNAAAYATQLVGTSVTSLAVGVGAKVFTTQTGKFFDAGNYLLITSDADPTNFMHGQVTTYAAGVLTMAITDIGGAGTLADWTIRLSGTQGTDAAGSSFLSLDDTPGGYGGAALQVVRVNGAANALEFSAAAPGTFIGQSDTPGVYAGAALYKLRVNGAANAVEFVLDESSGGGEEFSNLLMGG